jgi:hypothetical protein
VAAQVEAVVGMGMVEEGVVKAKSEGGKAVTSV